MKRASLALLGLMLVVSGSGCCCFDRLFCWGCRGPCAYGHEGPGGCSSCGGGCSDCGAIGRAGGGPGQPVYTQRGSDQSTYAQRRPAQGHPLVHERRDADGEYEFAAGPPTGATTYPYYTNRGPRDFLAKNPRSIGP